MRDLLNTLVLKVASALTNWPDPAGWGFTITIMLLLAALSFLAGVPTRFIRARPVRSLPVILAVALAGFITPAFAEELVFRVLLSPSRQDEISVTVRLGWTALATAAYVLYHPLNGLFFLKAGRSVFRDPVFLLLTTLLGAALSYLYYRTGSIWPCVLVHWVYTTSWLLFFGGLERFNDRRVFHERRPLELDETSDND